MVLKEERPDLNRGALTTELLLLVSIPSFPFPTSFPLCHHPFSSHSNTPLSSYSITLPSLPPLPSLPNPPPSLLSLLPIFLPPFPAPPPSTLPSLSPLSPLNHPPSCLHPPLPSPSPPSHAHLSGFLPLLFAGLSRAPFF